MEKSRIQSFKTGFGILSFLVGISMFSCQYDLSSKSNQEVEESFPAKVTIDQLALRWTFGNHEPINMYHRDGRVITGGIDGNALWLEDWHHWFDSDSCTTLIHELGFNILHSRFYKGMGWEFESKDFPNAKKFVENCHKHDIKVLAYVQFSTLYYEIMQNEIPDLENWAAIDKNGEKYIYHGFPNSYYRWIPCINNPAFEEYLKKVIRIALIDGDFDGIMFDNCYIPPCYCSRCQDQFRDYLSKEANPVKDLGLPTIEHVLPPYSTKENFGEIEDPISQRWLKFRCDNSTELFHRLYSFIKKCKLDAIVSGNSPIRSTNCAGERGLNVLELGKYFDIFLSQTDNAPGIQNGFIINRIRDYKIAKVLNTPVLALAERNFFSKTGPLTEKEAQTQAEQDELTLLEDIIFGGIPFDRTVLKPDKEKVSPLHLKYQAPMLKKFNEVVASHHRELAAKSYTPVKVLYSNESVMFSEKSVNSILGIEEILLRNHIPYGLLPVLSDKIFSIPDDCEVLVVCDQHCLGDAAIDTIKHFANRGGKLIVTGNSGEYDEYYRQRLKNPLTETFVNCKNVVVRSEGYKVPVIQSGFIIKVGAPEHGGSTFLGDLYQIWSPRIIIEAPETTFAEIKRDENSFYVHLLNYSQEPVKKVPFIKFSSKGQKLTAGIISTPLESIFEKTISAKSLTNGSNSLEIPIFERYALITLETEAKSE